jgi:hypothetical protein
LPSSLIAHFKERGHDPSKLTKDQEHKLFDGQDPLSFDLNLLIWPLSCTGLIQNEDFAFIFTYWFFNNLRYRSTSKHKDEAVCIASIFRLDIVAILSLPKEQWLLQIFKSLPLVPSGILFFKAQEDKKRAADGFPRSYRGLLDMIYFWEI